MIKPISFKIQKSQDHALLVQIDKGAAFYKQLHYHPEFQITAIVRGGGVLYGGNSMTVFAETSVFLIGANVPHLLESTPVSTIQEEEGIKGVSLFFDEFSFGKQFFEIREMIRLKSLLNTSSQVIEIKGNLKKDIYDKIISTPELTNEQLVITFLEILSLIYQAEKSYLNNEQYVLMLNENEGGRLNEVLAYTFKNYHQEITIDQIAQIALLSRSQFSYFFKLHTDKTYIQFLNELRVENACISLKNTNFTIERICYEVGFKNISNFVRHFKKIKKITPSSYRKSWKN